MSVDPELQQRLTDALKRHHVPGASLAIFAGETLREAAAGVVNAPRYLRLEGRVHRRVD